MTGTRNDRDMTGVLYGGVRGFWVRRNIIITTIVLYLCLFAEKDVLT